LEGNEKEKMGVFAGKGELEDLRGEKEKGKRRSSSRAKPRRDKAANQKKLENREKEERKKRGYCENRGIRYGKKIRVGSG